MRTTNYIDVANGVADLCGLDRDDVPHLNAKQIRQHISNRLKQAWEYHYWPELCFTDRRYFRPVFNIAATYQVLDGEVYYPYDGTYYQSLQGSNLGHVPGATASLAWWVRMEASYSADTYSSIITYLMGARVYDPSTDGVYQLYTASSLGNDPIDFTNWTLLVPLTKHILFNQAGRRAIGDAFGAFDKDPANYANASELGMSMGTMGYSFGGRGSGGSVWLSYRIPCPILRGDLFDATRVYYIGEQIYFAAAGYPGNFYNCNTVTLAGESPATASAFWDIQEIPQIFHHYLQYAAYADWLLTGGQVDRSTIQSAKADKLLSQQAFLYSGQQGIRQRTIVNTR